MKRFVTFFLLLLLPFIILGQVPESTPINKEQNDVVKISTSLIQVDVVVTDSKGNQITDLKPEDFEMYVNDEIQKITNFDYVSAADGKVANGNINVVKSGSGIKNSSAPTFGEVRKTVAIVVDDLRIPLDSLNYVKKALTKFVTEQMGDNDLVAIIKTSKSVGVLQQFTTDKKKLLEIIQNLQFRSGTAGIGAFSPLEITFSEKVKENIMITLEKVAKQVSAEGAVEGKSKMPLMKDDANQKAIETFKSIGDGTKLSNSIRNEFLTSGTLSVLNATITGMKSLPGRKSILFIAPGLDFTTLDTEAAQSDKSGRGPTLSPITKTSGVENLLRTITENANRSSVSIYALDPRGTQPINLSASDNTREGMMTSMTRQDIQNQVNLNSRNFLESQSPLKFFADQTGGAAFINSNDLSKGLLDALNSQNGYYLLAYQPDSDTFDPQKQRFNKFTVKVKRPNVRVTYRSGFFNVTETEEEKAAASPDRIFLEKLFSPYVFNEIPTKVTAIYAGNERTSLIRSFVSIDSNSLKFIDDKEGNKTANIDLLATSFDENGVPIIFTGKTFELKLSPKAFEKIADNGIALSLSFAPQSSGKHKIKIAVRDLNSGRIGSAVNEIEVLNLNNKLIGGSGLLLQTLTSQEFQSIRSGKPMLDAKAMSDRTQQDTAVRKFKKGAILTFNYAIYLSTQIKNKLQTQLTLSKDGKEVFKGQPEDVGFTPNGKIQILPKSGALTLSQELVSGSYLLQISISGADLKESEFQTINFDLIN